jgi:small basic protein
MKKVWLVIRIVVCLLLVLGVLSSISNLIQGRGYAALLAIHYMIPAIDRWDDHQQFLLDQIFNLILCGVLAYFVAPRQWLKEIRLSNSNPKGRSPGSAGVAVEL